MQFLQTHKISSLKSTLLMFKWMRRSKVQSRTRAAFYAEILFSKDWIFSSEDDGPYMPRSEGQSRCGWKTTRSRPCHGQPNLHTEPPLKISGTWSRGRRTLTSHLTKPSCRQTSHEIMQQQCERRAEITARHMEAAQDEQIRADSPNIDSLTCSNENISNVLFKKYRNKNVFFHYFRSENRIIFLLFFQIFCNFLLKSCQQFIGWSIKC